MSATFIIGLIAAVLCCLLAYAFIFQSAEHKSEQKQRLLMAFKQRLMSLISIADGLPQGFLTKDLSGLMYHCIIDVSEQLVRLDSRNLFYRNTLADYKNLMANINNQNHGSTFAFKNSQDCKNVQQFLHQFHGIIETLQTQNKLRSIYASGFSQQIQELILQASIEECFLLAKKSKEDGNQQTELLHYRHSLDLLAKTNTGGRFDAQISQVNTKITRLEKNILTLKENTKNASGILSGKNNHSPTASGQQRF